MTLAPFRPTGLDDRGNGPGGPVQRIHFTTEDLARVQVGATLGPVAETVFALALVGRRGRPLFAEWQRRVKADLGGYTDLVRRVAGAVAPVPDLLWLLQDEAPDPEGPVAAVGRREVVTAVRALCRRGVVPYWGPVLAHLEAERDARGRMIMSAGIEQVFEGMGPGVAWRPPVLSVPAAVDGDVHLHGRGLLLAPSLFLSRTPAVLVRTAAEERPPVLAFATTPEGNAGALLWQREQPDTRPPGVEALDALLGRTRARLLWHTRVSCSTGELAEQLGVSAASVSQHTRVLREAGLIATSRTKNKALHSITALGAAMLGGRRRPASSWANQGPGTGTFGLG